MKTETQIIEKIREIKFTNRAHLIENKKPFISTNTKLNNIVLKTLRWTLEDRGKA